MDHFIHEINESDATIAAIATPPGEGGVGIVRISGREALDVADHLFSGNVKTYESHTAHFGKILTKEGVVIDEGLLLILKKGKSYTGDDTAEIQCHGGSLITRQVLERVLQDPRVRLAKPGEFTYRSFINGNIDLAQAEAVQTLIGAKNQLALKAAQEQLQGKLSKVVTETQTSLTDIAAIFDAWVDYPEEGLEFASFEEVKKTILNNLNILQKLNKTYQGGKMIQEGINLCLVGSPNVGKSSLMNALLDKDRAIVSDIAGTTRDVIEDELKINGLHFKITDTAGIRLTDHALEQEGIRRSLEALKKANLVLFILDASRGLTEEDQTIINNLPEGKTIAVWNKTDLPHNPLQKLPIPSVAYVSAKYGTGLEELHKLIDQVIWSGHHPSSDEIIITSERHHAALKEAIELLQQVLNGLENHLSAEFISFDMRGVLKALGKIRGRNVTEDILSSIFRNFCVGK